MQTHKVVTTVSAVALAIGLALPVAALSVDTNAAGNLQVGANSGAVQTVQTTGQQSGSVNAGVSGSANGSGSTDVNGSANDSTASNIVLMTRADLDRATDVNADGSANVSGSMNANFSGTSADVKSTADLNGYVRSQMRADENFEQVQSSGNSVAVTYKDHARFFGFIPTTVNATAIVDGSGNVTMQYPWYSFLMATNKANLQAKIQDSVRSNWSANASANAQLSADAQARIIAAIKSKMAEEFKAAASTSADANANASGSANTQ